MQCFCIALLLCAICSARCSQRVRDEDEAWLREKQLSHEAATFSSSRSHVLRLSPNEDLLSSLWRYARALDIKSASVISAVGSLRRTNIRYANESTGVSLEGAFEIVSLVGNIDYQQTNAEGYTGNGHIHISCSDSEGGTIGGHLLSGNLVYTTVEVTLVEFIGGLFLRQPDDGPNGSGYNELKIYSNDS